MPASLEAEVTYNKNIKMLPVILAGGTGSRLWPLSRSSHPKQFLPLLGEQTMLQATLARLEDMEDIDPPLVLCNDEHRFLVAEQLREQGIDNPQIVLEPVGRNTAPAIAIAALVTVERDPEALLLVLPADHLIPDTAAFHHAVEQGRTTAEQGYLVTFGIVPTGPETGFGYIRANPGDGCLTVDEFVEKPDSATAETYLKSGAYYWNSGMFLFKAARILEELEKYAPDILDSCRASLAESARDLDFTRLAPESFTACPNTSIDYAVLEKTEAAALIPLDAGWNDIGSWAALHDVERDAETGNVLRGDILVEDVRDCYIRSEGRLVAAVGVANCIIVETPDAVLVADKSRSQDVKTIVERLKKADRGECNFHRRVHRPWGFYEGVTRSDRFLVKHIIVNPGAALSLQMHHHRAEHWVVVKGTAKVTCGDEVRLISEDQSTYIPIGSVHRLENPGMIPLEIIEVQSGSYVGEDDIVRLEDNYQRIT